MIIKGKATFETTAGDKAVTKDFELQAGIPADTPAHGVNSAVLNLVSGLINISGGGAAAKSLTITVK